MIRNDFAFIEYFEAFERFAVRNDLNYVTVCMFENHAAQFDAEYLLSLPFWYSCVYPGDTNYRIALIKRYYCRDTKRPH
ncbi:MAG: hypothetical protein CMP20_01585 [Rickettsiales bacterium]|nr:hypothetical protein [Rickettsiales bacterium]